MNAFERNSVIFGLLHVGYKDEGLIDKACLNLMEETKKNKGTVEIKTLTNLLYILAKLKYLP